jgi:MFS family permease
MFEVAYFVTSPLMGHYLDRIGRKNSITLGFILIFLGTWGFAILTLMKNDAGFFVLSLLLRFI